MNSIQDIFTQDHSGDVRDPLMQTLNESCQYNIRFDTVHKRELIDIKQHKLLDFASCNYLSFDQEQDRLLQSGIDAVKK